MGVGNTTTSFFHQIVFFIRCETQITLSHNKIAKIEARRAINNLIENFPNIDVKVYYGGPVDTDNLYFVYRAPHKIDGSVHIVSDMYWGGNLEQIKNLLNNGILGIDDIRFFLGYSGWDYNQLIDEIKNQSWVIDEFEDCLFDMDVSKLWEDRLCLKENKYKLWVNAPKDISLN